MLNLLKLISPNFTKITFRNNAYWSSNWFLSLELVFRTFHECVSKLEKISTSGAISSIALVKRLVQLSTNSCTGFPFRKHTVLFTNKTTMISINKVESKAKLKLRDHIYLLPSSYHLRPRCEHHWMEWNWKAIYSSFDTSIYYAYIIYTVVRHNYAWMHYRIQLIFLKVACRK